jgi:hypothetical protein
MHKSATKCNETLGKWCKNKHGASKIMDTLETYHATKWRLPHTLFLLTHMLDMSQYIYIYLQLDMSQFIKYANEDLMHDTFSHLLIWREPVSRINFF